MELVLKDMMGTIVIVGGQLSKDLYVLMVCIEIISFTPKFYSIYISDILDGSFSIF